MMEFWDKNPQSRTTSTSTARGCATGHQIFTQKFV